MPIHPSSSYHKYNVSDYYAIDPDYGTLADFEELIAQCDTRGIRVIMDLVVNHTASDHPWLKKRYPICNPCRRGHSLILRIASIWITISSPRRV